MMSRIGIIGVPTNSSGTMDGVAQAPQVLHEVGLVDALAEGCDMKDHGDVNFAAPSPERGSSGIIAEPSLISMTYAVRSAATLARAWITDSPLPSNLVALYER